MKIPSRLKPVSAEGLCGAAAYTALVEPASRFVPCNGQFGSGSINMPAGLAPAWLRHER
jgi:hypothetical protein